MRAYVEALRLRRAASNTAEQYSNQRRRCRAGLRRARRRRAGTSRRCYGARARLPASRAARHGRAAWGAAWGAGTARCRRAARPAAGTPARNPWARMDLAHARLACRVRAVRGAADCVRDFPTAIGRRRPAAPAFAKRIDSETRPGDSMLSAIAAARTGRRTPATINRLRRRRAARASRRRRRHAQRAARAAVACSPARSPAWQRTRATCAYTRTHSPHTHPVAACATAFPGLIRR